MYTHTIGTYICIRMHGLIGKLTSNRTRPRTPIHTHAHRATTICNIERERERYGARARHRYMYTRNSMTVRDRERNTEKDRQREMWKWRWRQRERERLSPDGHYLLSCPPIAKRRAMASKRAGSASSGTRAHRRLRTRPQPN